MELEQSRQLELHSLCNPDYSRVVVPHIGIMKGYQNVQMQFVRWAEKHSEAFSAEVAFFAMTSIA